MAGGTRKGKNGKVGIRLWGIPALVCLTFGLGACMNGQSASPRQEAAPVVPAEQAAPNLPVFMEAPIGAQVTAPPVAPAAGVPSPTGARVVYVPVVVSNPAERAEVAPAAPAGRTGASASDPARPRGREIYTQEGAAAPAAQGVANAGSAGATQAGAVSPAAGVPAWNPQGQPAPEGARPLAAAPRQDQRAAQTPPPPRKVMPEGPVTTVSVPVSRAVAQAAPAESTPQAPAQTPPPPPAPPTVPAWDPHAQPVVSTPAAVSPAPAGAASPTVTAASGKPARASAPAAAPQAPAAPVRPTDQSAYKAALAAYQAKRFEDSERAFDAFLRDYPNSKLIPNALYWKGESLYSRRLYPEAIFVFKDVTARYPKHQKASDALLKAGMAYGRMNDEDNARLHYQVLMEDYPSSPAARRAKELKLLK